VRRRRHQPQVLLAEDGGLIAVERNCAQDVLVGLDQGDQRRAWHCAAGRAKLQPARVVLHVVHHNRSAMAHSPAAQPLAQRQRERLLAFKRRLLARPAEARAEDQPLGLCVHLQDRALHRANGAGDHLQRAVEQALHVQAGGQFGGDAIQRGKLLALLL